MTDGGQAETPRRRYLRRATVGVAATYLAAMAALAIGLRYGDANTGLTVVLFGPRWLAALPLLVLVPLILATRSYWAAGLWLLAGLVVAGPVTGGTVSVGGAFASEERTPETLRVVSWNRGGIQAKTAFQEFVLRTNPTVIVCQESKLNAAELPPGWTILSHWGNTVATPLPIRAAGHLDFGDLAVGGQVDRFVLTFSGKEVTLVDVHLPTVRPGMELAMGTKCRDLSEMRRIIAIRAEASKRAGVAGRSPERDPRRRFQHAGRERHLPRGLGGIQERVLRRGQRLGNHEADELVRNPHRPCAMYIAVALPQCLGRF